MFSMRSASFSHMDCFFGSVSEVQIGLFQETLNPTLKIVTYSRKSPGNLPKTSKVPDANGIS